MSWHGTLTCTYCYERGHSRRKCPSMKKRHDEYAEALSQGKADDMSYSHRHAYNEYKNQQSSLKESNKVCAFCNGHGHRVNTCPKRMEAVDALREVDQWWASFLRITFEKYGLGIGTIFQGTGYVGDDYRHDIPHIVTGLSGNHGHANGRGALSFVQLLDRGRFAVQSTNMLTMRYGVARVSDGFWVYLYRELFDRLSGGELDFDFVENYYGEANRQYRDHPLIAILSHSIPRKYNTDDVDDSWLVSSHSEPFKERDELWFDFKAKREINKLFRDDKCKTALVNERHARSVVSFHELLKERGEI